jgi:hypothetical protein
MRPWLTLGWFSLATALYAGLLGCTARNLSFDECDGLAPAACAAAGCYAAYCPGCDAGRTYQGCFPDARSAGACPLYDCAPACEGLDERSCASRPECVYDGCPDCDGKIIYAQCRARVAPPPPCPAIACAPRCQDELDEAACSARPDCHPVFDDRSALCDCAAPGCCVTYARCAPGKPDCKGPALCRAAPPACGGRFVVAYENACYEGCVLAEDCR